MIYCKINHFNINIFVMRKHYMAFKIIFSWTYAVAFAAFQS